jgi:hypothetical protein
VLSDPELDSLGLCAFLFFDVCAGGHCRCCRIRTGPAAGGGVLLVGNAMS